MRKRSLMSIIGSLIRSPQAVLGGIFQGRNPQAAHATGPLPPSELQQDAYFLTRLKSPPGFSDAAKEPATDSAAAGTALATGFKTDNGNIAWKPGDPAGSPLTTIAETLRLENGFAIGVASTVQFSAATPAAFVSHNVNRTNYSQIAAEILNAVQPEVVIGGGHPLYFSGVPIYNYVGGLANWNQLLGYATPYILAQR